MKITDEMVQALRQGREAARKLEGFAYNPFNVIRDLRKEPGQQEVWRGAYEDWEGFHTELDRRRDVEVIAAVAPTVAAAAIADLVAENERLHLAYVAAKEGIARLLVENEELRAALPHP